MNLKKLVGEKAATYVQDGMIVGLGTGSTAFYMIEELGRRIHEEQLQIIGVPTSKASEDHARTLGIPIQSVDEVTQIDLTIDGADEISPDFQGIKGGGGALLYEKIVATYSKKVIWIVDESKMVPNLGNFPLPVEVIPYGSQQLFQLFKQNNWQPTFRMNTKLERKITDSGHYIIDLHLGVIEDPFILAKELKQLVGVVEHGLFLNCADIVIVGKTHELETLVVNK